MPDDGSPRRLIAELDKAQAQLDALRRENALLRKELATMRVLHALTLAQVLATPGGRRRQMRFCSAIGISLAGLMLRVESRTRPHGMVPD